MAVAAATLFAAFTGAAANPDVAQHWAFQPVQAVKPPEVKNTAWVKTDIDRFILARLEQHQLQPAPPADRRGLIRRATFDLLGLPPTPDEVESFIADVTPGAFERVVDRLLNSSHYGERWGRHWLDVARYADNKGYVFFEEKSFPWAWTYRDYVVRAFNEDEPYNQFVLEQLAADQLDRLGDDRILTALGFLTVGDHFSNNTHDILDDRIDVVTRGLLGLTVGCARCHDHKFDPVTMEDYYALYGVFRSCTEPMVPPAIEPPVLSETYEGFELELIRREQKLQEFVESKHRAIVQGARTRLAEYLLAAYAQRNQPSTESFMLIADKEDLNPAVVARWRAYLDRVGPAHPVWRPWLEFSRIEEGKGETYFAEQAARVQVAWTASAPGVNPRVASAFSGAALRSMKEVAARYAALFKSVNEQWQAALAQTAPPAPARLPRPEDEELRQILYGTDAPPDVPLQMDWGFLSLLPDRASQGEFQKILTSLEQWLMQGPAAPARAMVLQDLPVAYQPRVFLRGNPNRPGPLVSRRFVHLLDPERRAFSKGSGRLELARAITDPGNPLAARVFVNRIWMHHFGTGLVTTPSDFGTRSQAPSHPELLDWLAREFVQGGWRVKRLHRLIMSSAVYQQSSMAPAPPSRSSTVLTNGGTFIAGASNADLPAVDAENRWLGRFPRLRHDFETQRDALLAVAGQLDAQTGGPPAELSSNRRTIYTFVNRMDVPPVMTTFDFPSPSASCPQRSATTVAPQALFLMNNESVAKAAAAVLKRAEIAGTATVPAKAERLYALFYGRPPTATDLRHAEHFLGASPDEKLWAQYVHALLMANEFVFVD
jgi:hypothetical protein